MNSLDSFKKFVEPIYGHLMGHSLIFQQPSEVQLEFKRNITKILLETTDRDLKTLLWDSNWRCSLVGSWLIFLRNKTEFTDDICNFLSQNKAGTIGYCFALAKFGTMKSSENLVKYLERELTFDNSPNEGFQDTAMCSLVFIDKKNNTTYSNSFIEPSGLWTKFIEFPYLKDHKLRDSERWGNFDKTYHNFVQMMDFMNTLTKQ